MKKYFLLAFLSCQFVLAQQVKFFRTYGHGIYDSGEGVWQANDVGYVVAGITTQSGSNGTDVMMYKTDSMGVLEWYKPIGLNNCIEGARSLTCGESKTAYILAGYQNKYDTSGYNFYVVKTDLNGDTLWTRTYGGSDWDMAYSVDTLQDSTYVIAGETFSYGQGNLDMYIIRIDQHGDTLWTRTFGGTEDDYASYVFTDKFNRIIVVGTTSSFGAGGSDVYMVCLDAAGNTIWTKAYGGQSDEYGYSGDMYIDNGGHMWYAFSYTQLDSSSMLQESRFLRADSSACTPISDNGWFQSQPEILDHPHMRKYAKGRFYVTGDIRYSENGYTDIYLHRTNYSIGFSSTQLIVPVPLGSEYPHDLRVCLDKGLIVTGATTSYGPGPTSSFILKTDTMLVSPWTPVVAVEDYEQINFKIYPNPVTAHTLYIDAGFPIKQVRLYDMSGRVVQAIKGENFVTQAVTLDDLPDGMYIAEVVTEKGSGRKKILVSQ